MKLYKPSSTSGRMSVKSPKVKGTSFKQGKGLKISSLKFKVPKVKVSKIKI